MHTRVNKQVLHIWIVMLAVLFSALAPAVSQAVAASRPAGMEVQICTMAGTKTIVVGQSAPPAVDHLFEHCPYCATHGGAAAPPPGAHIVLPASSAWAPYPPLFYQCAAPQFTWTAANPRAPPVLS